MRTFPLVQPRLATGQRALTGVLVALALAAVATVVVGVTGSVSFAGQVVGRPVAVIEDVPGPETGPVCPLDERYVDEQPDGLRPDVLSAWKRLRAKAGEQGVRMCLNDGKRSASQQQAEFEDAVERFGTPELAARYVLPPEKSMHVKGIAVDVQPLDAAAWVEGTGGELGWCRRYENEAWHFEYDRGYVSDGCPALLPSATGA